jgi:hypothetical protein
MGAGGDPNIHLLPSRVISDTLFADVLRDFEANPPFIAPPLSAKTWIDPFESNPEALFDEEAAEQAEEEATPENFDGVDYALALAVDSAELRTMWPDFANKGQVFIRHVAKPPRKGASSKDKKKAVFETSSVRVWANGPVLAWCDSAQAENQSAPACRVHLLQVAEMFQGSQPGLQSYAASADDKLCFTIRTHPKSSDGAGVRTLSLQAHSHEQRQQWWTALKAIMAHIAGATEAYNETNPSSEWTLQPAPAELVQDGFDWTDEPDFPDERGVPEDMVPHGPNGFAQDDVRMDAALQAADQRREVLHDITMRMNGNSTALLSTLLAKERQQDTRRRDKYLEEKAQAEEEARASDKKKVRGSAISKGAAGDSKPLEPETPAHLWFELINNLKYGIRVSAVSSEVALDSLGYYTEPSRDEYSAVSVVDKFAPVAADLRPRCDAEPSVLLQELAPTVFARLRRHWGIPLSEYVLEVGTAEDFVRVIQTTDEDDADLCGPAGFPAPNGSLIGAGSGRGKDRKTQWLTSTGQFWMQTLNERQARFFASWMRLYFEHVSDTRSDTFLIRIVGMYHVRTPAIPSGKYVVVFRNPISSERYVHWRYELSGAAPAASAPEMLQKQAVPVYFDAEADRDNLELALRPQQLRLMVSQLRRDLQFLARVSAFGYHVSVAISHQDVTEKRMLEGTLAPPASLGARFGLGLREREFSVLNEDIARMSPEEEDRYDELLAALPPLELYPPDVTALESNWTLEAGGIYSSRYDDIDEAMFPDAIAYFVWIGDIFGEFDSQMAWDLWWGRSEAGSDFVDPAKYAVKFASAFEARCVSEHPEFIARRARAQAKKQEAAALAAAHAAARGILPGITATGGVAMSAAAAHAAAAAALGSSITRPGDEATRGGFGSGMRVSPRAAARGRDASMPAFNLTADTAAPSSGGGGGGGSRYRNPLDIDIDDDDDAGGHGGGGTAYADY